MAGHSKWSNIKRRKGAADAQRGKIFTKLGKEIIVAARMGGGDIEGNARLRAAVLAARAQSMPKDNIERAIKKGTGELEGVMIEEITYEGYGPGGVAIVVETATDNKNRMVADLRNIFKSSGGNLGETGSVAFQFNYQGQLLFDKSKFTEDQIMEVALEAGADDISEEDESIQVLMPPTSVFQVREVFEKAEMVPESSGFTYVPSVKVPVTREHAEKLLKLFEKLDDHDDVQRVHSNFEMDEKLFEELQAS